MLEFYRKIAEAYGRLGLFSKIALVVALTIVTTAMGVLVVVWLPSDHFSRRGAPLGWWHQHRVTRWAMIIARNLLGIVILPLGLVMLVGPGPGLVFTLLGLSLVDLPGKKSIERKIITRPGVLRTINELRASFGRSPFTVDQE